ncbi:MAG: preQ(1) synthase [Gemmatimonadales bacterium]
MREARKQPAAALPRVGPLPRPATPAQAREVLKAEAFPAPDVQMVTLAAGEFTSICPRTGQPDFGSVIIEYTPAGRCLESKALKYYLWSYRDEGAFCESLAGRIADDVVYAIAPRTVRVQVSQNVRGGIAIVAEARRGKGEGGKGKGKAV